VAVKMDKTIAGFYAHLDATPRQADVINDIYRKYLKRGGPPLTDGK
jgi:hypothetical protein